MGNKHTDIHIEDGDGMTPMLRWGEVDSIAVYKQVDQSGLDTRENVCACSKYCLLVLIKTMAASGAFHERHIVLFENKSRFRACAVFFFHARLSIRRPTLHKVVEVANPSPTQAIFGVCWS